MQVWEWIFWSSLFLVVYPYGLYPAAIWLASKIKEALHRRKPYKLEEFPEVTIVIPAYKEADSVKPKMESIRRLEYPSDKVHILWVISTDEKDSSLASTLDALSQYPEAKYIIVHRRGKNVALNAARSTVQTPLVLFSDANALLAPQSLKAAVLHLMRPPMADAVGGYRLIYTQGAHAFAHTESPYLRYEGILRKAESTFDCALGLPGEFLLLRTELWLPIPEEAGDDQYLVLRLGLSGKRLRFAPEALAYEQPSRDSKIEFHRKVRIACNAFHTIRLGFSLSEALRHPVFSFFFISHKGFRYLIAPIALIVMLISGGVLCVTHAGYFYCILFGAMLAAWMQASLLIFVPRMKLLQAMTAPGYFVLVHLAQIAGFWRFLRKDDPLKVWQRLPRMDLQPSTHDVKI
ncbi:MAG: glycosyltransferase [Bacteroidia bacterium]|nr:glycosyltransferase [Bacteroidia bacterium]MCX7651327.1 glycosyltransferase [Bacteroidia bacterium]MDW8417153.1 glycosyltransferase [Bacteroidia bacterium]